MREVKFKIPYENFRKVVEVHKKAIALGYSPGLAGSIAAYYGGVPIFIHQADPVRIVFEAE